MRRVSISQQEDGVLPRWQAVERYGAARVRRCLTNGTWQSPLRRVVVTHNGTLTARELTLAALLSCPPGSVLGGWSAWPSTG